MSEVFNIYYIETSNKHSCVTNNNTCQICLDKLLILVWSFFMLWDIKIDHLILVVQVGIYEADRYWLEDEPNDCYRLVNN